MKVVEVNSEAAGEEYENQQEQISDSHNTQMSLGEVEVDPINAI